MVINVYTEEWKRYIGLSIIQTKFQRLWESICLYQSIIGLRAIILLQTFSVLLNSLKQWSLWGWIPGTGLVSNRGLTKIKFAQNQYLTYKMLLNKDVNGGIKRC